VTGRVLAKGRRSGVLVAAGTAIGILCHATLAGLGLAALVMRSSEAFAVVKLAGAGYLVVLGVLTVIRARRRPRDGVESAPAARRLPWQVRGDFTGGLLGSVLNPKAAAVYLTLAPQFLSTGHRVFAQMLVLAVAHIVVAVGWLLSWTLVVSAARATVRSRRFRALLEQLTGLVLVTMGVRTAVTA
jgi:threonine/homoserine/homoserine lactone efflux protein